MAKTHKLTAADRDEITNLYRAGVATINEATRAFTRGDTAQIDAWHAQIEAERQAEITRFKAESARFEAQRATWKAFEPITHKCARCGADVVQTDSEIPPYTLSAGEWLCPACDAARRTANVQRSHEAGRRSAAEIARSEANDRWERGDD
jgi:hypothetical protein